MPEGDTLFRTAEVLRSVLGGRRIVAARGRAGGAHVERLAGSTVTDVRAQGKHLLIGTDAGLTLHTHLRMHGSWHRYRAGEAWRRAPSTAVAVLDVGDAVAVCFDAPVVEVIETRALAIHPALRALGPDLLGADPDLGEALRRLRSTSRADVAIGDALLDQRAQAGLGNVYRSEVCFIERVDPFAPVGAFDDATLRRLLATGRRLLDANRSTPLRTTMPGPDGSPPGAGTPRPRGDRLWVYGRTGRPCRRCGTPVASTTSGPLARRTYWCPACQAPRTGTLPDG